MKRMYRVIYSRPNPTAPERRLEVPVGVAFTSDRVRILRLRLDAIPLNFDGELLVRLDAPLSEIPEPELPPSQDQKTQALPGKCGHGVRGPCVSCEAEVGY